MDTAIVRKGALLIGAVIICQGIGLIGSLFTTQKIPTWYATLVKPAFNPPSWLFGPVWICLYLLMGISLFLIFQEKESCARTRALTLFGLQLVMNALWSFLFFGLESPLYGLIGIVLLLIAIILTMGASYRVSRLAAYLFIPYVCWVAFATIVNYFIYIMNP